MRKRFFSIVLVMTMLAGMTGYVAAASVVQEIERPVILVSNVPTNISAATIDGETYFKLRDLAGVVSGTANGFQLQWYQDGTIELKKGESYTSENNQRLDLAVETATQEKLQIRASGQTISVDSYCLNGYNYLTASDLSRVTGLEILWDELNLCYKLVPEDFQTGVSLTVLDDTVTNTGLAFHLVNYSDKIITIGTMVILEYYDEQASGWNRVPMIIDNFGWDASARYLGGEDPELQQYDREMNWELYYGVLAPGLYRVVKEYRVEGYGDYTLTCEFQL